MSLHTDRAYEKLRKSGGLAGALSFDQWNGLANMSKRELVEIAMRLGGLCTDECDNADMAYDRVLEEHNALKQAGIL